jgi:hypothetical protein
MDTHVGVLVRLRHRRHCRHSQVDGFCGPNFAQWHQALDRMGIDCSSVIEILDYVAIANEGK